MNPNEIRVPRKFVNAAIIALVILAVLLLSRGRLSFLGIEGSQDTTNSASNLIPGSAGKFALLSGLGGQRSVGST